MSDKLVAPFQVKAVDDEERTFEGYASTWDLDLGDDVIHEGAFKETLAEWRKSGKAMPLLNSHNYFDIMSGVGQMLDAKEDKRGLWTKWEVIDGPDGDAVLSRMRPSRRTGKAVIGSMSIGYAALKWDEEERSDSRYGVVRNLHKVALKEVSLVLFPMNPGATIDAASVKSALASGDVPEDVLEAIRHAAPDLVPEGKQEEGSASLDWDTPGNTPLDLIRLQRIRSRSLALKSGIII
jgi:HK97 family phage prohead protease